MTIVADKIIISGKVHTMQPGIDERNAITQAIAIKDDKIIATGSNEDIKLLADRSTKVIDAKGNLVLPGLQDTHIHFQLSSADLYHSAVLYEAQTLDQALAIIKDYSEKNPHKKWIRGMGFDAGIFSEQELTKEALDSVTGSRPALILANDYHNGWANSKAFELAGVTAGSKEPENGRFARCEDGNPKGFIFEDAIWHMAKSAPGYSDDELLEAMTHYSKEFNKHGITGVLDAMAPRSYLKNYRALNDLGDLTLRVRCTSKIFAHNPLQPQLDELISMREEYNDDMVSLHSAKFFLDGVMENGTANFIDPRSDNGENAELMFTPQQINEYFTAFDKERFQLHVHTIGDGAVRAALDGIEAAQLTNGKWDSRHQLAHLQVVDPHDIPRFKQLGVLANFQALWAQPNEENDNLVHGMLGKTRSEWIFPVGEFVAQGATCMLSSDWGVSTFEPFPIIQSGITRQTLEANEDSEVNTPQHRIDIQTAIEGYTINAAHAAWREDVTGSIEVGKYADLAIFDQDVFRISAYNIHKTKALLTLLGGKEVYRADGF